MPQRAFVLTPGYRVTGGRAEVRLFVALEGGEPALVIDDRSRPYLFVRSSDAARLRLAEGAPTRLRAFDGEPVVRLEAPTPDALDQRRQRLERAGAECLEADVSLAYRFLMDRGLRSAITIDGPFERRPGLGRVYRNPELAPARWMPRLRVLSLDIETTMDGERLLSIGVAGHGGERVFLVKSPAWRDEPPALPSWAEALPDERAVLERLVRHVVEVDPDVLTGWNIPDFDLPRLSHYARRAGVRLSLGRGGGELRVKKGEGYWQQSRAQLDGRVVLDGISLARWSSSRLEDLRLETAARAILGRGKLLSGEHRGEDIEASYRDEPAFFCEYNLEDCRLVLDILEKARLLELSVRRSLLTGLPPDRVNGQIAAVDSLYLPALRSLGRVAPSVPSGDGPHEPIAGGLLLPPRPGLFRNVLVYDFKSLYPSLIRTFGIDPLTHAAGGDSNRNRSITRTPDGSAFKRDEPGVLPALVERLWRQRTRAQEAGDAQGAQAIKILMNSLYGVLGTPASRLYCPAAANAIAHAGQHVIKLAARAAERRGHRVLYGDTDSLFVEARVGDEAEAHALAEPLREAIASDIAVSLLADFGCESRLELEHEKLYARFFLPELRASLRHAGGAPGEAGDEAEGSKKRYAGLSRTPSGDEQLEVVGLEAVRRDASPLARRFQRELLDRVFHDEPVEPFVRAFVAALRAGELDHELVYRKAVRKPLSSYTSTTPPHVKAARLLGDRAGRLVHYVVTRQGPEPVERLSAPPDHEHYVRTQLAPIARTIFGALGRDDADELLAEAVQLSLF